MSVRTRMKELRARDGLRQADLARKVGVRRETISFVENGEYNPSLLLAVKIARVFEASVEEVFQYDEDELKLDL
jgi:putative transcriptional regulator